MNIDKIKKIEALNNTLHDGYALTVNQTRAFLSECQTRVDESGQIFVLFCGHYLRLCNEDDAGDVMTCVRVQEYVGDTMARVAMSCMFGARVDEKNFIVVDALTDG